MNPYLELVVQFVLMLVASYLATFIRKPRRRATRRHHRRNPKHCVMCDSLLSEYNRDPCHPTRCCACTGGYVEDDED